ncbi:MAG TPA: thioredoxin [Pyrinomonadaceae bacterium]|nr:thioredoxin [Pyrinomonadaceae bacterium]
METIVACGNCGAKNRLDERAARERQRAVCGQCGAQLQADAATQTANAGTKPVMVTDASFAREVLGAGARPVLLDCWAEWCGPCRMIAPALDQLAAESQGRYTIAKLNVDENPRTSAEFGVRSIPTLLIFKHGQLVERIVGAHPKQTIAARLAAHV